MQLCISLAARPSNLGTRFHNYLYDEFGLNFIYKAFSTTDLEGAVRGIRALNIRGCSVSMPFKEDIIPMVDELLPSAAAIESVNAVVNNDGHLVASNTDFQAVLDLLNENQLDVNQSVLIRGSGGMAKAVIAAFAKAGFEDVTVLARNEQRGQSLAKLYGYQWASESLLESQQNNFDALVNVTPLGMAGTDEKVQSFPNAFVDAASIIFDVVAFPAETPLIKAGLLNDKKIITGAQVIALQAALQFEAYTGIRPTAEQVKRAAEFSRS